jgi:hypothetical protein
LAWLISRSVGPLIDQSQSHTARACPCLHERRGRDGLGQVLLQPLHRRSCWRSRRDERQQQKGSRPRSRSKRGSRKHLCVFVCVCAL